MWLRVIINNCNFLIEITVYNTIGTEISNKTLKDIGIKFSKTSDKTNLG